MGIGQTLRLLRVAADRSQQGLAHDLGITANYLSLVEHGHREPSLRFLRRFGQVLQVPIGDLLFLALADEEGERL